MYVEFFESVGWGAQAAPTAAAALARLQHVPRPQAIVFDFLLPDMTAVDFCHALRRLPGWDPSVRLVIVTGWLISPEDHRALAQLGIAEVYLKPCAPDALLATLHAVGAAAPWPNPSA